MQTYRQTIRNGDSLAGDFFVWLNVRGIIELILIVINFEFEYL